MPRKVKRQPTLRHVPEEEIFLRYDSISDQIAGEFAKLIGKLFDKAKNGISEQRLAAAQSLESPSLVKLAANWTQMEAEFRAILAPPIDESKPLDEVKAGRGPSVSNPFAGLDASGLMQRAIDAGIQLGVETLPTAEARAAGVDVNQARQLAYRTIDRNLIKQSLQALRESRDALAMLVEHPKHLMGTVGSDVRSVLDGRTLRELFGLDKRQAKTLVNELAGLAADRNLSRSELRKYVLRRYRQMLRARIDLLAKTLASEAINKGQAAAWAVARKNGTLKAGFVKEWVARVLPCPRCLAFDGKRVPLDKPFVSDRGETATDPPLHFRCRCRARLVKPRSERGRTERSRRLRRAA